MKNLATEIIVAANIGSMLSSIRHDSHSGVIITDDPLSTSVSVSNIITRNDYVEEVKSGKERRRERRKANRK